MNLYILNEVLCDYTVGVGMCVIAAESMARCEQLFMKKFANDYNKEFMQKEFNSAPIKVIENINHPEGVVGVTQ